MGYQDRPRALLQATRRAGNEATDYLQCRARPFGRVLDRHLLSHHLSVLPARQEMVARSRLYAQYD